MIHTYKVRVISLQFLVRSAGNMTFPHISYFNCLGGLYFIFQCFLAPKVFQKIWETDCFLMPSRLHVKTLVCHPPQGSGSREPLFGRSAALVSPTHVFPPLEGACGSSGSLLLGPLGILKYDPSQYFNYNSQAHISYFTKNGSPNIVRF
jgi:hypothetical protein